jgi:hypothetical protein
MSQSNDHRIVVDLAQEKRQEPGSGILSHDSRKMLTGKMTPAAPNP